VPVPVPPETQSPQRFTGLPVAIAIEVVVALAQQLLCTGVGADLTAGKPGDCMPALRAGRIRRNHPGSGRRLHSPWPADQPWPSSPCVPSRKREGALSATTPPAATACPAPAVAPAGRSRKPVSPARWAGSARATTASRAADRHGLRFRRCARTTVGLSGTGLSWSAEHSPDHTAAIPAGVAEGLPNSRLLADGSLGGRTTGLLALIETPEALQAGRAGGGSPGPAPPRRRSAWPGACGPADGPAAPE
jgi:hypothetical protein